MASEVKNSWLTRAVDGNNHPCNILVGRTPNDRVVVGVTSPDGTAFLPVDDAIKLRTRLGHAIDAAALGHGDVEWPKRKRP